MVPGFARGSSRRDGSVPLLSLAPGPLQQAGGVQSWHGEFSHGQAQQQERSAQQRANQLQVMAPMVLEDIGQGKACNVPPDLLRALEVGGLVQTHDDLTYVNSPMTMSA